VTTTGTSAIIPRTQTLLTPSTIRLCIVGPPKSMLRAQPVNAGKHARMHDHPKNKKAKAALYQQVRDKAPDVVPTCAVSLGMRFYMPRPQNHYCTGRNAPQLKDWAVNLRHKKKPDLDNLIKLVKDALTGVFWHDDSQVDEYSPIPRKAYSDKPRTEIVITYDERK